MSGALRASDPSLQRHGILALGLNQDNSCVALATTSGILIYNLQSHACIYSHPVGAISTVQMLFCTSLVAYVGAGLQPALTPRKLTLLNTATSTPIQDIIFPNVVLSILLNKSRLVAVLEQQACVYAVQNLAHVCSIPTLSNKHGVGALSTCELPCLLALPAGPAPSGMLRVYNLLSAGAPELVATGVSGGLSAAAQGPGASSVLCEVQAHSAPVAAVAWYHDTSLLATASTKGTVIRVHRMPQATCMAAFRRGTMPATIHALAWSPPHIQPPILAVSSSRGSVHIFRLDDDGPARGTSALGLKAAGGASGVAVGLLSAVMRLSPVQPMAGPQPSIASIRLPVDGSTATLGLLPRPATPPSAQQPPPTPFHTADEISQGRTAQQLSSSVDKAFDADSVLLIVATLGGILYEYSITRLHALVKRGDTGAVCTLEGEWALRSTGGDVEATEEAEPPTPQGAVRL